MIIVSIILILINCVALPLLSHYCLKFRCYLKELYEYPYIKRICDLLFSSKCIRFLYKGIIIKHNKTEPTYTKTSLFLCEKRRFFMARTEKGVVTTI